MKFIDVHCHINDRDYGDVGDLLRGIKRAGVEKIIAVGFDLQSSEYCRKLSEKYDGVYFTAGFHPTELKSYKEGDLDAIADLTFHKKCVAIGEIGLDYHYPDTDKPMQTEIFLRQLDIAEKLGMPVQIHSRDCAEDMFNILKQRRQTCGAMMHCYSHSAEIATELEKLGMYFSFGGTSTYSGSKRAKKAVSAIGCDRLMTETDSPYLPPKSKYGTFPNTPASIPEIAANMAELKGLCLEDMCDKVWSNAHMLFKKLNG